jgi:regulator of sirC expression with transglutaminase-like and TPR domain
MGGPEQSRGRPCEEPGLVVSAANRARFADLVRSDDPDLAELALLVANEAYPDLDVDHYMGCVDALADSARSLGATADAVVVTLRASGLQGDAQTYDDPRNSFLNDVLDRRRGLPITLSAVTLATAQRVGVPMIGVALPGHFVVADTSPETPRYFDPFHGWAAISADDCAQMVRRTAGIPFEKRFLAPVGADAILRRMLANLRTSLLRRRRLRDALWTVELGLILDSTDQALVRQLAMLLGAVGRYDEAIAISTAAMKDDPASPHAVAHAAQIAAVHDSMRRMS